MSAARLGTRDSVRIAHGRVGRSRLARLDHEVAGPCDGLS
jgi:hypothetical protein